MREQDSRAQNEYNLRKLGREIDQSEKVLVTLNTPGWKEIIGPILDKMIEDVVGGKRDGRWHNGALDDKRLGEIKLQNLCWYKRGLTDFHTYVHQFIDSLPASKKEYEDIVKEETDPNYNDVETGYE